MDISVFWELFRIFFEFPDFSIIFRLFSFILLIYSNFCQAVFVQRSVSSGSQLRTDWHRGPKMNTKDFRVNLKIFMWGKINGLPQHFESFFTPWPNQGRDLPAEPSVYSKYHKISILIQTRAVECLFFIGKTPNLKSTCYFVSFRKIFKVFWVLFLQIGCLYVKEKRKCVVIF